MTDLSRVEIGLVGDFDTSVPAHEAIPAALQSAATALAIGIQVEWVPTERIDRTARIERFNGLWCVPGSPYRSFEGALRAIRFARESGTPFLGTCGGFQHAIIEYARNVLGWNDADHAETNPHGKRLVITPLDCALEDSEAEIRFVADSTIARAYGTDRAVERYRCAYSLDEQFADALSASTLQTSAYDADGHVRAVELRGHPFFVATLFQPERAALAGRAAPLVEAFAAACAGLTPHAR